MREFWLTKGVDGWVVTDKPTHGMSVGYEEIHVREVVPGRRAQPDADAELALRVEELEKELAELEHVRAGWQSAAEEWKQASKQWAENASRWEAQCQMKNEIISGYKELLQRADEHSQRLVAIVERHTLGKLQG